MRILGQSTLSKFLDSHADARTWVVNWVADVRGSHWTSFHDIRDKYPSASFLANSIVIFNVRGNNHRLETQVAFGTQVIAVKWIGTHAEYNHRYG